jgi:hypothetical protein
MIMLGEQLQQLEPREVDIVIFARRDEMRIDPLCHGCLPF